MGQQGNLTSLVFPLAMFAAIFYFMIIRPQKKKQKLHNEMVASITTGDKVVTAGGFVGLVNKVLDDSYIIIMDQEANTKARVLKSSVSMKMVEDTAVAPKPKKKKKVKKDEKITSDTQTVKEEVAPVKEAAEDVVDASEQE